MMYNKEINSIKIKRIEIPSYNDLLKEQENKYLFPIHHIIIETKWGKLWTHMGRPFNLKSPEGDFNELVIALIFPWNISMDFNFSFYKYIAAQLTGILLMYEKTISIKIESPIDSEELSKQILHYVESDFSPKIIQTVSS